MIVYSFLKLSHFELEHLTFTFSHFHSNQYLKIQSWSSIGTANMSENYLEAKAVLNVVKSSTWRFFKFRVVRGDVDKSFVHCKLCLDQGNKKRGQIKYCGGTTNLLLLMRIGWKQFFLVMHLYFSFLLPCKNYFASLRLVEINRRLIGAPF